MTDATNPAADTPVSVPAYSTDAIAGIVRNLTGSNHGLVLAAAQANDLAEAAVIGSVTKTQAWADLATAVSKAMGQADATSANTLRQYGPACSAFVKECGEDLATLPAPSARVLRDLNRHAVADKSGKTRADYLKSWREAAAVTTDSKAVAKAVESLTGIDPVQAKADADKAKADAATRTKATEPPTMAEVLNTLNALAGILADDAFVMLAAADADAHASVVAAVASMAKSVQKLNRAQVAMTKAANKAKADAATAAADKAKADAADRAADKAEQREARIAGAA